MKMTFPGRTRLLMDWWLVLAGALALAALCVHQGWTVRLDYPAYDLALAHVGGPHPEPDIVIVAVDENSLGQFGSWPWPRATLARLVERIAAARPRSLGLNVMLIEPSDPQGDADLARAIARATHEQIRVVLPAAFRASGEPGDPVTAEPPLGLFRASGALVGHVNQALDRDGTVRRFHPAYGEDGQAWPVLGAAMLGRTTAGEATVAAGERMTGTPPLLIAYQGGHEGFATVSASAILDGKVPPSLLAGREVLVGLTAPGLGDRLVTPVNGGQMLSGVEIQAAILHTLKSHRPVRSASEPLKLVLALAPLALLFVAMRRLRPALTGLAVIVLAAASVLGSVLLLRYGATWSSPVTPVLAMALAWPIWAWVRLVVTGQFIARQLEHAAAGAGALGFAPAGASVLDRELALLEAAAARERQLRADHDEVIRLLSHDMRAPQSAILALTECAGDEPIGAETVERIRANARRTLALADGFVQLSRAQLLEWQPQTLDLAEIARDAADLVWALGRERGIDVKVDGPADGEGLPLPVWTRGEPSLLQRAIANLAENAIKFGEPRAAVTIAVAGDGRETRVTVSNRGAEIPSELQSRLFERFRRADALGSRGNGVGLGLAFVHAVAVRHGGRAECRSAGGETRFALVLPAAPDEMA